MTTDKLLEYAFDRIEDVLDWHARVRGKPPGRAEKIVGNIFVTAIVCTVAAAGASYMTYLVWSTDDKDLDPEPAQRKPLVLPDDWWPTTDMRVLPTNSRLVN